MPALDDVIAAALKRGFGGAVPKKIGVAVSGGGDSMALLDLLRRWGRTELAVASVNHGLREEAADEIALVASYCADHGIAHDVLIWKWDGTGNLQSAARDGRRTALREWANAHDISHVALGHTADDQAETFLMRLARGSGVDGLAGMAEARTEDAVTWLRPLLGARREALREHLSGAGVSWADDPSNEDVKFDRVKARQMMETLSPLGLSSERLVQTADHMAREKDALAWAASQAKAQSAQVVAGDVVFGVSSLTNLPESMALRVLADALCFVSGETYKPRFKALRTALHSPTDTALHGCLILRDAQSVTVTREWRAVQDLQSRVGGVWDGRWWIDGPEAEGCHVTALGEVGLQRCPDWREAGLPRQSLLSSPAIWREGALISAPLAGFAGAYRAELIDGRDVFA